MYESFFGFREKPFNLTPDPRFVYLSARHTEAFAHLAYGHQERGGFVVITGEVGAGKTTLARYFLSRLGPESASAVVLYPALTAEELLRSILDDLHVTRRGASLKDLVDALHGFLLQARRQGRTVVLLIDEAQALPAEALEQVRLISNLETDTEKLIQIVLIGQPELADLLGRHELRQLAQRVTARYHLGALDRREVAAYVRRRLEVAGESSAIEFTPAALAEVFAFSRGIPRLINLVCDRALLAGYVRGGRVIEPDMVRLAARELRPAAPRQLPLPAMIAAAAALAAILLALVWPRTASSPTLPTAPEAAAPSATPPTPAPPQLIGAIEQALLPTAREASLVSAIARVEAAWEGARVERAPLRLETPLIRLLDLPVVLELLLPGGQTRHVALVGLAGDSATLDLGDARRRVSWAALEVLWTRNAIVLWKDFESLALAPDPGWATRWALDRLQAAGYSGPPGELAGPLARFQAEAGLVADGVLGPRTLMALYSRAGYPRPRLQDPAP